MQDNVFFDSNNIIQFDDKEVDLTKLDRSQVLSANTVLFRVTIGGFSNEKKVSTSKIVDEKKLIDKTLVKTTKKLIDKTYFDGITQLDGEFRRRLSALGHKPSFIASGYTLIPVNAIRHAVRELKDYRDKRQVMIETLISRYPEAKSNAKQRSPDLYVEADYPTVEDLRRKFYVSEDIQGVEPFPDILHRIDAELAAEYQEKQTKMKADALEEIEFSMREELAEFINNLLDKVTKMDTERKVFSDGFVRNFRDFIDFFDVKNITKDDELSKQVEIVKNLLNGVTPDDLRNNFETKRKVEINLSKVSAALDSMMVKKVRDIDL